MTMEQQQSLAKLKQEVLTSAANHGLQLREDKIEWNESGMDFLVAFAHDHEDQAWVLRKPRRSDVWERAENEYKALALLRNQLSVKVPDWRIVSPELIAYPLLEGDPVAVVDPAGGGYAWRYDQATLSETFFDSLAEALASLHAIDRDKAAAAGLRVKSPAQSRAEFADNIDKISRSFTIPDALMKRWTAWLHTDSYWPEYTVLHHGDLHPPHILVDASHRVTGLIDWTEAEVADPGKDFMIHYALFGPEGLKDLLSRYEQAGGQRWPRMAEHIAEQWAAYPAVVANFALITGRDSDREMAIGMIANWENMLASISGYDY